MREFVIGKNDAGQRLDKFLSKALRTLPPSLMYKAVRTKKIKLNRKRCEPGTVLSEGDTVQCFLAEEFFIAARDPESAYLSIEPKLDIVYEDDQIILINKKVGMLCHSDKEGDTNTLIDHLKAYLYKKGEYRPSEENSFAPALCNRIDRNTGGIVIGAKTASALRDMNEMIKQGKVRKFYLCAVKGKLPKAHDILVSYLTKDGDENKVTVYDKPAKGRMKIITEYTLLKDNGRESLLEVELHTGKTHQIRSHLAYIGCPLLGDGKYGVNREDGKRGYHHQALWSYKISFELLKPSTLEYLNGKTFSVERSVIPFYKDFK